MHHRVYQMRINIRVLINILRMHVSLSSCASVTSRRIRRTTKAAVTDTYSKSRGIRRSAIRSRDVFTIRHNLYLCDITWENALTFSLSLFLCVDKWLRLSLKAVFCYLMQWLKGICTWITLWLFLWRVSGISQRASLSRDLEFMNNIKPTVRINFVVLVGI